MNTYHVKVKSSLIYRLVEADKIVGYNNVLSFQLKNQETVFIVPVDNVEYVEKVEVKDEDEDAGED